MEGITAGSSNHSLVNNTSHNTSSPLSAGLLYLPPTFVDAIIPGYSVLASTLLAHFGIDLSFLVSVVALFFAATTAFQVTINPAIDRLFSLITSTVIIDEYDSIFDHVLDWLSNQPSLQNHRILRAHTGGYNDDDDDDDLNFSSSSNDTDIIFNFNDFATRVSAKYEPHSTTGFFPYKGHLLRITREQQRIQNEYSDMVRDREKFIITVVWRSTAPIKTLIEEARELSFSKRTSSTVIFRPTPKPQRNHGNEWQSVTTRPSRSMNTVVLDDEQKHKCLADINEFLQAARWYSNRGIPYRRGYLFHGAPGTGKTSLSFALAGVFGLEVYCLSLTEVTLTEEDLIMLFTALPQRCIVLLEDIDCAGVSRPRPTIEKKKPKKKSKSKKSSSRKADTDTNPTKLTNAITISGLLNAIDGVATAEGRILIMTTNFPEKLDAALTRPGRIDMRIEFTLASKQQIKELFLRMYSVDAEESNKQPTRLSQIPGNKIASRRESSKEEEKAPIVGTGAPDSSEDTTVAIPEPTEPAGQQDSVEHLATLFAASLPEHTFSPAEIQGFLLMHKKSPGDAVKNVAAWRDEEMLTKERTSDKKGETPKRTLQESEATAKRGGEVVTQKSDTQPEDVVEAKENTAKHIKDLKKMDGKKSKKERDDTPRGSSSSDDNDDEDDGSSSSSSSDSDSDTN